jgi:hypothetical protein
MAGSCGWTLQVEVLVVSERGGRLHFRRDVSEVDPSESPHDVAVRLAGIDAEDPASFCHSTSWRVADSGAITVTYVALPDNAASRAVPLVASHIRAADDPLCPEPRDLDAENIAMHAVRHLAMLSREDPTVQELVPRARRLWQCIVNAAKLAETSVEADVASDTA